ncbi:MAG: MFS transporter [Candidatus Limnocylindrales bacterium]
MSSATAGTLAEGGEVVGGPADGGGPLGVFRNPAFLRLWLSQAATRIGGNMVLYGLTVIVVDNTSSNTAVSLLILSFLVPAVIFSAVAGVYVDRIDRRIILILTNFLRGLAIIGLYLVGANFLLILLLNTIVSTVTVFFAPAEAAMIPQVVPRSQLLAANGVFTLTLNAAFALGFALLGPLVVNLSSPEAVILIVAVLYFVAAAFCFTLPPSPPPPPDPTRTGPHPVGETQKAVQSTVSQLARGTRTSSGRTGPSAGRCSTLASPRRWSVSWESSGRTSRNRPWVSGPRTSRWSSCRSASGS